ncbi:MAG: GIY-YIG nuclease family protein [Patescibacteria group bacterium]
MRVENHILYSEKYDRYYIGSTGDISARLGRHNSGATQSTKACRPWVVVHQESFDTRTEARKREMQIKKYKGGGAFKQLVEVGAGTEAVKRDRL